MSNLLACLPEDMLWEILRRLRSHRRGLLAITSKHMLLLVRGCLQTRGSRWSFEGYKVIAEVIEPCPRCEELTNFTAIANAILARYGIWQFVCLRTVYAKAGTLISRASARDCLIYTKRARRPDISFQFPETYYRLHGFPYWLLENPKYSSAPSFIFVASRSQALNHPELSKTECARQVRRYL